jgi:hypothetical protein
LPPQNKKEWKKGSLVVYFFVSLSLSLSLSLLCSTVDCKAMP